MEIELDVLLIFYMYPSKCCPIMFTSDIETFRQETGIVQIAKLRTTSVQPRNCSVQPRNWEQLRNSCCENQTQRLISIVRIKPVSIVLWEPNPACCGNQTQRLICPVESYVPINCMKIINMKTGVHRLNEFPHGVFNYRIVVEVVAYLPLANFSCPYFFDTRRRCFFIGFSSQLYFAPLCR